MNKVLNKPFLPIFLLFAVWAVLGLRGIQYRIASTYGDDAPATFAEVLTHPQTYEGDLFYSDARVSVYSTAVHASTFIVKKLFQIDDNISLQFAWLVIQSLLLWSSIFVLSSAFLGVKGWRPATATAFIVLIWPFRWNLANFDLSGDTRLMVYSANISASLVFFYWADLLRQKRNRGFFFATASLLCHPVIGLIGFAVGLTQEYLVKKRISWLPAIAAVLIGLAPALFSQGMVTARVSADELIWTLLKVVHVTPWRLPNYLQYSLKYSELAVIFFSIWSLSRNWLTRDQRLLFVAVSLVTSILSLLHLLGFEARLGFLLKSYPLRSTQLISFFSVFMIVIAAIRPTFFGSIQKWESLLGLLCLGLVFHLFYNPDRSVLIPAALILALVFRQIRSNQWLLCAIGLALCFWFLREATYASSRSFYIVIAGLVLLAFINFMMFMRSSVFLTSIQRIALSSIIVFFAIYGAARTGIRDADYSNSERLKDRFDLLTWVRENTLESASFATFDWDGWRMTAKRKRIILGFLMIYRNTGDRTVKEVEMKILKFFGLSDADLADAWHNDINLMLAAKQREAREQLLSQIPETFGARYLVVDSSFRNFNLQVAYKNNSFTIYDLKPIDD